ncbi:hypothetical protein NUU61_002630 [Penicillium alfredii]|uniref:Calcium uniporter protein n=1 Tax=Penicillium alfredii TaxID=1506179 RepID=A0A9W9KH29_9EURO|nr:uncharacterized protein NUU61_002630 [Penicillium alfredii]KAJ5105283.1 hypothetical protein NUU61_002630 [Penicillium alfredii]
MGSSFRGSPRCSSNSFINRKGQWSPPITNSAIEPGSRQQVAGPRQWCGWKQTRSFTKANRPSTSNKEKTEELLESFEVREDEHDTQPQRQVLEEGRRRSQSGTQTDQWSEGITQGKMLTTPSRLFKLIIPLTIVSNQGQDKGIEPIAILVHPQQPLSYLERLIQSELPPIEGERERLRPPAVSFIALQHEDNAIKPKKRIEDDHELEGDKEPHLSGPASENHGYPRRADPDVDSSDANADRFVRWSQATEVGDFIRDAARTREFIVTIEGAPSGLGHIRVAVPSFNERTYFLRMRLRKLSRRIQRIAEVKQTCDSLAHRGAQRVAIGGFGILSTWWFTVYKLTFETDLGWDTMEPVTYLVSLSTLMGGYLWFLYHNREISYRSALDFTISARQKKLYQLHHVDLHMWESLIDEGNLLRREIKSIAAEYDAEWDERADEQDDRVTKVLRSERRQKNGKGQRGEDKDGHDDD